MEVESDSPRKVILHPDADGTPSDRVEYVSYLHIASVETATGQAA
jgi:hypothetical protein